jgi:hypothetical protein
MKFTIITGSGRCGSSALTQFFLNSGKYRIDSTGYDPKMRAGFESYNSIVANSLLYSSKEIYATRLLGIKKLFQIFNNYDIVKSPTFFYLNTYQEWHQALRNDGGIQVILLRRDPSEVLNSVQKIKSKDWDNVDEVKINQLWEENIFTLDDLSIPYIILDYPQFTKNPDYLYNNLSKLDLGNWKYDLQDITNLMYESFY